MRIWACGHMDIEQVMAHVHLQCGGDETLSLVCNIRRHPIPLSKGSGRSLDLIKTIGSCDDTRSPHQDAADVLKSWGMASHTSD